MTSDLNLEIMIDTPQGGMKLWGIPEKAERPLARPY